MLQVSRCSKLRPVLHVLPRCPLTGCSSQAHYCVAFGIKDERGILSDFDFQRFTAAPPRFPNAG